MCASERLRPRTTHYESFAKRPAKGSVYAYQVAAFEILDADPAPPLSLRPIDLTSDVSPEFRAYAERHNPLLETLQATRRRHHESLLLDAGLTPAQIADPSPGVQRLLKELDDGSFAEDYIFEQRREKLGGTANGPSATDRVLFAAKLFAFGKSTAAAKLLNEGSRERGLTRDHVDRAQRTFLKHCEGAPRFLVQCEFYVTPNRWLCLEELRSEAGRHPILKNYRGAELAYEMDERFDLPLRVEKMADRLNARGQAFPFPGRELREDRAADGSSIAR